MKIVPISRIPGGGRYIFETPVDLKKGDVVKCDTSRGESIGFCLSDSFVVDGNVLDFICSGYGASVKNMKSIIGVYMYSKFDKDPVKDEIW